MAADLGLASLGRLPSPVWMSDAAFTLDNFSVKGTTGYFVVNLTATILISSFFHIIHITCVIHFLHETHRTLAQVGVIRFLHKTI